MGIPANLVHILDYAFFLPAMILTGIWLLKGRPLAFTLAPVFAVFVILTGVPILLTPVLQAARRLPALRTRAGRRFRPGADPVPQAKGGP